MLQKPALDDWRLVAHLQQVYDLGTVQVVFLPLGADPNTAVYRATADGRSYFVKLRRGPFDELSVTLPYFLGEQDLSKQGLGEQGLSQHGAAHVIAPIPTRTGQLWAELEAFTLVLYPFVAGEDGYAVALTEQSWRAFGAALKHLHTLALPEALRRVVKQETFDAGARTLLKTWLSRLEQLAPTDSGLDDLAAQLVAVLEPKRTALEALVARTERLAQNLRGRELERVVCHADLHAGNLLITDSADGQQVYIVDWDDPILAPKERDLMFIGGAQGFAGYAPEEEEQLFYRGYGEAQIDPAALAYYRFERIIQDLAIYCDELLTGTGSEDDRRQSLDYLKANFRAGGTLEQAYAVAV